MDKRRVGYNRLIVLLLLLASKIVYAGDSTQAAIAVPGTSPPTTPFILDSGQVQIGAWLIGVSFWFEIWKQCPIGFTPYASFAPNIVSSAQGKMLNTFVVLPIGSTGACPFIQCTGCTPETAVKFDAQYRAQSPQADYYGSAGSWGGYIAYQVTCYPNSNLPAYPPQVFGQNGTWFDIGNGALGHNPPC